MSASAAASQRSSSRPRASASRNSGLDSLFRSSRHWSAERILVYAPSASALQLVAAEYFKPDADQNTATDDDRPTLFGRAFDGPMLGHAPGMPIHYDLHVWLWKANPSGTFATWNPALTC